MNLPNESISCESEQTIKHSTKESEYEIRDEKQDEAFNTNLTKVRVFTLS